MEEQSKESEQERSARNPLNLLSNHFSARIEGLREVLEVISPHVAVLDKPEGIATVIDRSGLSDDGKDAVKGLLLPSSDADAERDGSDVTKAEESASPDKTVNRLKHVVRNEPTGLLKVLRRFNQGAIAPRTSLLNGSLLTVAVASFESLLAGLYAQHLTIFPAQLKDDEKEFSLGDLAEIGSIDEARRVLIERRADGFMRRGLTDWSRWAKKVLGFSFEDVCLDYSHLNEMFQRRHLVVHSGGVVSRLYIERVKDFNGEKPTLGQQLPVSAAYLQRALDELEVLGYGLAAIAWAKWEPQNADDALSSLNSHIYDMLDSSNFISARKLSEVGSDLPQPGIRRWMIIVNGWIASKKVGDFDDCRSEVEAWDITALAHEFKLARACLLDEVDEAFHLLRAVLKESETKAGEVREWPLLDDLRPDPRFETIFQEAGYNRPSSEGPREDQA